MRSAGSCGLHRFSGSLKGIWVSAVAVMIMVPQVYSQTISEDRPSNIASAIIDDWKAQDGTNYSSVINEIKSSIPSKYGDKISGSGEDGYISACHWRRVSRMAPYAPELKELLCARHHDIGGFIIGYTEDINSDGVQGLGQWGMSAMGKSSDYPRGSTNTAIMKLTFDNYYPSPEDIISDDRGVLRDPCPSYDGKTLVYAHSKDNNGYHIWDMNLETGEKRQLTDDLKGSIPVSDFEPCVMPSGDIIFGSSRCFGQVDCNVNITSNMYIMNKDGKYLRRIGYDQVHTFCPTMMEDGSVMYTRWEYNDRNVANVFGVFTMYQDGTRQQEWYGNQTSWPATFNQARECPGTGGQMAIATIGGHQGPYAGDLVRVNISETRNGLGGVELIAPPRASGHGNAYNMDGVPPEDKLFQNPYPLSDEWFLISYRRTSNSKFSVYLMNTKGERELIAWNDSRSVSQPISLMEKDPPPQTMYQADYSKKTAAISVADVYYGMGTGSGVQKGSVKKIRVCAMEYHTTPSFGNTGSMSYQMTPVGRFGCSWEAKWIPGEAPVADDGSAAFEVPPNTPIFLQLIAENGTCIQTMRSWMTLMPGERFDCVGCHEDKCEAPPDRNPSKTTPEPLQPFWDVPQEVGSFYYPDVIQPILDAHCNKGGCHDNSHKMPLTKDLIWTNDLSDADNNGAYRYWTRSYYNLFNHVNVNAIFGGAEGLRPNSLGSVRSNVIRTLQGGHNDVHLSQEEMEKLCAWIDLAAPHSGTYTDDMKDEHAQKYRSQLAKREAEEEFEAQNIQEFIASGGYKVEPYSIGGVSARTPQKKASVVAEAFKARFIAAENMLTLDLPSEGKIRLLDLMGRQILAKKITREAFIESAEQNIKLELPAGTYIVKFDGVKRDSEQVVSIL